MRATKLQTSTVERVAFDLPPRFQIETDTGGTFEIVVEVDGLLIRNPEGLALSVWPDTSNQVKLRSDFSGELP